MDRRDVLTTAGAALTAVCGGCAGEFPVPRRSQSSTAVAVPTPDPGECVPAPMSRPSPDSSRARAYPALPGSPTRADSRSFATAFERASQFNDRLPAYGSIQTDVTAPRWATTAARDGYVVGLDVRVQFGDPMTSTPSETTGESTDTKTPRPSGFAEYAVYYLVTDRFALRGEPLTGDLERGAAPDLSGARTVACDGGDP